MKSFWFNLVPLSSKSSLVWLCAGVDQLRNQTLPVLFWIFCGKLWSYNEPPKVRVFAGVEQLRNGGTRPAATGRLCEWKEDPRWSFCFWCFCQKLSFRIDFNTTMQDRKLSSKNVWFQFRQPACVIFYLNPWNHCLFSLRVEGRSKVEFLFLMVLSKMII